MTPHMSPAELDCYRTHLAGARTLLEYGCGGSTLFALEEGVPRIWSVETDPGWIAGLRGEAAIRAAEAAGRLTLLHADIGAVGPWGRPLSPVPEPSWLDYPRLPWRHVTEAVEVVLVDGRFRAACMLVALEHLGPGARILVHDLVPARRSYLLPLPFLEPLEMVGTLGVFRPPRLLDRAGMRACLDRVQWIPL
jgi:hypothetical protein